MDDEFGDFEDATSPPERVQEAWGAHPQGSNEILSKDASRKSQPIPLEFFGEGENVKPNTPQSKFACLTTRAPFCVWARHRIEADMCQRSDSSH
jgi:hypothetical protein